MGLTPTLIDITREAAELDAFAGHEQIWLGRDIDRGLTAIVAIHNTALGPALAAPGSGRTSPSLRR